MISNPIYSHFKNDEGTGPKLDCSVGGLYYKIYADSHERRMAASIVIKPAHITHRKLHLQEENRNFPDTVSYMAAVKDTYLEKMLNTNPDLSIQTFCNQVFIHFYRFMLSSGSNRDVKMAQYGCKRDKSRVWVYKLISKWYFSLWIESFEMGHFDSVSRDTDKEIPRWPIFLFD